jgi:hypothetical protein
MVAASVVEMRLLVRLAAPAVLVYMINYLMSMSTQIFSGHLGTLELAAASLGNTGNQVFAYGLMVCTPPCPPPPLLFVFVMIVLFIYLLYLFIYICLYCYIYYGVLFYCTE